MNQKRIIVVLGMHRSGTSAITRGLTSLGVELGDNLIPPVSGNNDKGFWEDIDLQRFNERLLRKLESSWQRIALFQTDRLLNDEFSAERSEASELIERKLSGAAVFGFKDPRTTILLPFWQCVFDDLGIDHRYIIALRNPLEVAESLRKRDNQDPTHSIALWLKYCWAAIKFTTGKDRICVSFATLLTDPVGQLERIASRLDLTTPSRSSPAVKEYADEFLSADLKHNRISNRELERSERVPKLVHDLHLQMFQWAQLPASQDCILPARLARQISEYWTNIQPLLNLYDQCLTANSANSEKAADAGRESAELKVKNQSLEGSLNGAWNELAPLREKFAASEARVLALEAASADFASQFSEAANRIEAAYAETHQRDLIVGRIEAEAVELKLSERQAREELEIAKVSATQLAEQIAQLEASKQTIEASLHGAWDELAPLRDKYALLAARESEREELIISLHQAKAALETSLEAATNDLDILRENSLRDTARIAAILSESEALSSELEQSRLHLDSAQSQALQVGYDLASTRTELAEAQREAASQATRLNQLTSETDSLRSELLEARLRLEFSEAKVKQLGSELESRRAELAAEQGAVRHLQLDVMALKEQAERNLAICTEALSDLTKKLDAANSASDLASELSRANSQLKSALTNQEKHSSDLAAEVSKLKTRTLELEAELLQFKHEHQEVNERLLDLQADNEQLANDARARATVLEEAQTALKDTTRNLRIARGEVLRLNSELDGLSKEASSQLAERETEADSLRALLAVSEQELTQRETELGQLAINSSDLTRQNRILVKELEQFKGQVLAIKNSTSWRITMPMRGLARLLTRRR